MITNSAAKEDQHYLGVIGYPSENEEHTIHPKKNDSTWNKIYACRDMFYDHHWEVRNTVVAGAKGALLGVAYASGFALLNKTIPSLVLKKMFRFIRSNNFGTLRVLNDLMLPYAATGFFLGSSYYFYQTVFCSNPSNRFTTDVVSNAIFFQAASAIVINPSVHVYGMLAGIIFGVAKHNFYTSNYAQQQASIGSYTTFGNLTPEERKKQEYKDYIENLGRYHNVRGGHLTEI